MSPTPSIQQLRFISLYSSELKAWCRDLESSSDSILAIARKGPRLLELMVRAGMLSQSVKDRVITQRALPFIREKSERLIILDDVLTYGSTFSRICDLATRVLPTSRGNKHVQIVGLPFAVCETVPNAFRQQIQRHFLDLRYDEVAAFVHAEMDAFRFLGKANEIENPALTVNGEFHDIPRTELAVSMIARVLKGQVVPLHQDVPLGNAIERSYNWLIVLDADDQLSTQYPPEFRVIRVYRDQQGDKLRFFAIRHCALDASTWNALVNCLPEQLQSLWHLCQPAALPNDTVVASAIGQSMAMWANYLKKVMLLSEVQSSVIRHLETLFTVHGWHGPTQADLRYLIGRELAENASRAITGFFSLSADTRKTNSKIPNVSDLSDRLFPEKYPPRYETQYRSTLNSLAANAVDASEIVESIFHAQHLAIDVPSRDLKVEPHGRLEFGIRFSTLVSIVKDYFPATSESSVLTILARLIDDGVVVPTYNNFSRDDSPIWCRVYRVGEGMPPRRMQTVSLLFTKLKEALKDGPIPVPALLFEKFCALVLDVGKDLANLRDLQRILAIKGFDVFGAREQFQFGKRRHFLTDWAVKKVILVPQTTPFTLEDAQGYTLAADLTERYPATEIPWDRNVQRSIRDVAAFVAFLHKADGLKTDALVTLTSVATDNECFLAIEAELDLWINHPRFSIYQATRALTDFSKRKHIFRSPEHVNEILTGTARFLAQVKKKVDLSGSRENCFAKISSGLLNRDQTIQDLWADLSGIIKNRSNFEPEPLAHSKILSALRVAHRATSLLRDVLSSSGYTRDPERDRKVRPLNVSIQMLCDAINGTGAHACDPTVRPFFEDSRNGHRGICVQAKELLASEKLSGFDSAVLPVCELVEDVAHRCEEILRCYGSEGFSEPPVELPPPRFVLLWDVRGSSQQSDRRLLQNVLTQAGEIICRTLQSSIDNFDHLSLNDGNGLIAKDFKTVVAAFKILHEVLGTASLRVRAGCAVNLEGSLLHYPKSGRLGGKAYESTARVMDFYKEVSESQNRWKGTPLTKPADTESYLLVHEFAMRYADVSDQWSSTSDDFSVQQLDGSYTPRMAGALPVAIWSVSPHRQKPDTKFLPKED